MQKILTIIIILGLTKCSQPSKQLPSKTLDFGAFTIETPNSWTKIKEKGFDSYVGGIAIDEKDTLRFDLGWYSNRLSEDDPTLMDSSIINSIDTSLIDTSDVIFVKNSITADIDKYRKNNVSWDIIDGRKAKIVYPRKSGVGTTGIYIDTLWIVNGNRDKFNLAGYNLKPDNEKKTLQAIKTLKFRRE